ncbi:MAG: hypothetical protein ACLPTM_01575 [Steroidobacteraceae bacterium]
MRTLTPLALAALFSVTTLSGAAASSTASSVHVYPLPDHGRLLLSVPDDWKEEIKSPQPGAPTALWFSARSGASFNVLITPITAPKPENTVPDDVAIRAMVSASARKLESQSVEKQLLLKDLVGPTCRGYFFVATDKAPAPEEWKYLAQGVVRIGGIALAFSVLTNDGQQPIAKAAIEMVRQAVYRPRDTTGE